MPRTCRKFRHGGFLKGAAEGAVEGKDWFNAVCEAFTFAEDARTSMLPPRYANKNLAMDALFIRVFKGGMGRRAILKRARHTLPN